MFSNFQIQRACNSYRENYSWDPQSTAVPSLTMSEHLSYTNGNLKMESWSSSTPFCHISTYPGPQNLSCCFHPKTGKSFQPSEWSGCRDRLKIMGEPRGTQRLVSGYSDATQEPLIAFLALTHIQPRWVTCPLGRTSHIFISFAFVSSFRSFLIFSSSSVVFTESVWRASRSITRPNLLIISWWTVSSISKRRHHCLSVFSGPHCY